MDTEKGKVQEAINRQLLEDRKVFLWGMVDDKSAKHVVDRLAESSSFRSHDRIFAAWICLYGVLSVCLVFALKRRSCLCVV